MEISTNKIVVYLREYSKLNQRLYHTCIVGGKAILALLIEEETQAISILLRSSATAHALVF